MTVFFSLIQFHEVIVIEIIQFVGLLCMKSKRSIYFYCEFNHHQKLVDLMWMQIKTIGFQNN